MFSSPLSQLFCAFSHFSHDIISTTGVADASRNLDAALKIASVSQPRHLGPSDWRNEHDVDNVIGDERVTAKERVSTSTRLRASRRLPFHEGRQERVKGKGQGQGKGKGKVADTSSGKGSLGKGHSEGRSGDGSGQFIGAYRRCGQRIRSESQRRWTDECVEQVRRFRARHTHNLEEGEEEDTVDSANLESLAVQRGEWQHVVHLRIASQNL